jgi:signal transduction histidine kinase
MAAEPAVARRREVLRQASVVLRGRPVVLWEVSPEAALLPVLSSAARDRPPAAGAHDLAATLAGWHTALIEGSRWVGCRLEEGGRWCVAPVRTLPPAPPPGTGERRSRERLTLELAGLCMGLLDRPSAGRQPRLPERDALTELSRHPSVIAHEVANPLTAALAGLEVYKDRLRTAALPDAGLRTELLDELGGVESAIEQAVAFLRAIQDRARGALARSERFDAAGVVRSCVTLERPLARKRGIALQGVVALSDVFLRGDPNALYQVLTNLIRNAVTASQPRRTAVAVELTRAGEELRLTVRDEGIGIAAEHLDRIFEPGFTTQGFGAGSGTGLTVVREIVETMFAGRVEVDSTLGAGTTFRAVLPIPAQRGSPARG